MSRRRNKRNNIGRQIGRTYGYPEMGKKMAAGAGTPSSQSNIKMDLKYTQKGGKCQWL